MKKIWYINPYSGGPGISRAFRPYLLSREWIKSSFSVRVITSSYHHLFYKEESLYGKKIVDGVEYCFVNTQKYRGNGISRIINMLTFPINLYKYFKVPFNQETPDVIIYSSPHLFGFITAKLLAKKFESKLILEIRDIWPMSLVQIAGASKFHPLVLVNKLLERFAYANCDAIVGLPSALDSHIKATSRKRVPFIHIPNGVNINKYVSEPRQDFSETGSKIIECIKLLRLKKKNVAIYAGGHGKPNALEQFIEAAKMLQERGYNKLTLLFIGDGVSKKNLIHAALSVDLRNVYFFDVVSKNELGVIYGMVDFAFIGWLDRQIYEFGISPNKLSEYLLFRLPVLHAVRTVEEPIARSGAGLSVDPGDVTAICKAFVQLSESSDEERRRMADLGANYVKNHYDVKKLAAKYAELF